MKSLYVLPNGASCRPAAINRPWGLLSTRAACVGWRSSVYRASPPPGIFLMTGVGLERDFWVLFGGLKFAWCQAKGIWLQLRLAGYPGRSSTSSPDVYHLGPCNVRPTRCNMGSTARAFCHHTCWAIRWSFLPSWAWAGISLGNCRGKSSILWQPANLSPRLGQHTISLLQISTVLVQYDGYIHYLHYLQTLSPCLKLWF